MHDRGGAFAVGFGDLEIWSVSAQFVANWSWPPSVVKPLSDALVRRSEAASDTLGPDAVVTMLTIRFDGSIEPRAPVRVKDIKGRLYRAYPEDVVFSKIDVRNGAIGLAPNGIERICVTSEFPVYCVDVQKAEPAFVKLLFRTTVFKRILNSMISGASGRKRIQPSQLEKVRIPIPPMPVQREIVAHWHAAEQRKASADAAFSALAADLDTHLVGRTCVFKGITRARRFVARFENTHKWDLKGGRAAAFIAANADFIQLGDCSEECTEIVNAWEQPDRPWPIYGVNNREGVFLSSLQKGRDFNASYKKIEKDWFFHNPTRANVGSLGIVGEVPDDAITSPEYQVWRLNGVFLPEFMALMFRTDYFLTLVAINRVGGVKQRMYYSNLAEIRLPKIPLSVQRDFARRRSGILGDINAAKKMLSVRTAEVEEMIVGARSGKAS